MLKNKKNIIMIIIILLCFGFLFFNKKNIEIPYNIKWNENPNQVAEKISNIELTHYKNYDSKVKINADNLKVQAHNVILEINDVKSSSSSLGLEEIPLYSYSFVSSHNGNREIVNAYEEFRITSDYSSNIYTDSDILYNSLVTRTEKNGAKFVKELPEWNEDYSNLLYKTSKNYISIEKIEDGGEFRITITYFNPKYTEKDIENRTYFNDMI